MERFINGVTCTAIMELELIISEEDIKAVLTGQRKSIMKAAETIGVGGKIDYHPNLFTETAIAAAVILEVNEGIKALTGEADYGVLSHLLRSLPVVARELHEATVEGHMAKAESVGNYIIHAYFTLLSGVAMACNKLLRISTTGLEEKIAGQLVSARKYLAKVVVEANALYGKATTAEFLQLTDSGRAEYVNNLLPNVLKP